MTNISKRCYGHQHCCICWGNYLSLFLPKTTAPPAVSGGRTTKVSHDRGRGFKQPELGVLGLAMQYKRHARPGLLAKLNGTVIRDACVAYLAHIIMQCSHSFRRFLTVQSNSKRLLHAYPAFQELTQRGITRNGHHSLVNTRVTQCHPRGISTLRPAWHLTNI